MTATATPSRVRVQNIPAELRDIDHWIVFAVSPGRGGKLDKRPYVPGTQNLAASNDPLTWTGFDLALADTERTGRFLGFCFTPELGYVFLDFDQVLGAHGAVKTYAATVIDTLDSYSEVSAGGNGVHVFVRGALPEDFSKDQIGGKVEVYPQAGGRFCLVTGDTRPGLGSLDGIIEERTAQLAALFPPRPRVTPTAPQNGTPTAQLGETELDVIVAAMRPSWSLGQKHDMGVALGGVLAKNGIALEQALTIAARLSVDDAKPKDREKAVRDSYRRAEAGLDVRGYQALRDMMPPEALAIVDGVLSRVWQAQQPQLVTPGRKITLQPARQDTDAGDVDRWPSPPPEVYHGWFGGYLELVRETTEAPDQFHLAAALTVIGACAGRNVYTRHASGRVYPNFYTVLVGLSGESKKDTSIDRALTMLRNPLPTREHWSPPFTERYGIQSSPSFIKHLSSHPNTLLRMSEFSEILATARRKGTSDVLTLLMKAWDTPAQLTNDSLANQATADNPYVSILAGTQPDVLATDLVNTDITSGFANRILFVPGSGKPKMPRPAELDEVKLHEHWIIVKRNLARYSGGDFVPIEWSSESEAVWDAFYADSRAETTIERTMAQRHQNHVLKVALVFALTDCSTVITIEHLRKAIALIEWDWACIQQLIRSWATSNDNRLEERILKVLKATGPIKRRVLWHKAKDPRWSANDFARLIRSMTENGTIGVDGDGFVGIRED